ncbi:MAG TPA: O-antigen ligase family protein, partial [Longimicrobium sp.]|nr:O-antigen ligase family protein [Longimicrobium sp.]
MFWALLLFLVSFPLNLLGAVALIALLAYLITASRLLSRRPLVLNAKDALFLVYAVCATAATLVGDRELMFVVRLVVFPWLVSFVFQNVPLTRRQLTLATDAMLLVATVIGAAMLFQDASGNFHFTLQQLLAVQESRRVFYFSSAQMGINGAAFLLAAAFLIALAQIKFAWGSAALRVALLPVLFTLLIFAGARSVWLGAGAGLVLFLFFGRALPRWRSPVPTLSRVLVAVGIVVAAVLSFRALISDSGIGFLTRMEGFTNPLDDATLLVRLRYWQLAVDMIHQHPLGAGFNAYYAKYGRTPHNEVLGQLIGAGWLGAAVYFAVFGYLCWRAVKLLRSRSGAEAFVPYLAVSLLALMAFGMATENITRVTLGTLAPLFWAVMGMMLQRADAPAPRRRPGRRPAPARWRRPRGVPRRPRAPEPGGEGARAPGA